MDSRLLHFEIHLKFTFRDETGTIPLCENAGEISIPTVRAYSRVSLPPFGKFLARVPAVNRETAELRFEGKGKVFPFNGRDCCAPASQLRGSKAKSNEFSRLSEILPIR